MGVAIAQEPLLTICPIVYLAIRPFFLLIFAANFNLVGKATIRIRDLLIDNH